LVVFVLRSFLFEPFKIPSGSMIPTLWVGDLILVNKFHYGVRLPVLNTKLTDGEPVRRGDVMVFRYPPKPSLDYIKRVVAVPGDEVAYLNKQLSINGQPVPKASLPDFFEEDSLSYIKQFQETFPTGASPSMMVPTKAVRLLNNAERPAFIAGTEDFPFKNQCSYSVEGVVCKVPPGHFFMMGDNRDNSLDSRYWGFVPEANIVGKAIMVWMNFSHIKRIGAID
jgi:signal peptidase I